MNSIKLSITILMIILGMVNYSAGEIESQYNYLKQNTRTQLNTIQPSQVTDPIPLPVNGGSVQSSVTSTERIIVFVFSPPVDGLYAIETSPNFLGDSIDTFISLFGPDDPTVFITSDDDGGEGSLSLIAAELEGGGVYFITVEAFDSVETGPFQVEVRTQPDINVLDASLSASAYVSDMAFEPAAITSDPESGLLYITAPLTSGELWVVQQDGTIELLQNQFSNASNSGFFYPFLSTDIQYFNGQVFTVLSDGSNGEIVGISIAGDIQVFAQKAGTGFEAGIDVQDNLLILSDGEGSAETVTSFNFETGNDALIARGAADSQINAIEVAQNTQEIFGSDSINGLLRIEQGSITAAANGIIIDGPGYFAVDPNGEFFYITDNESLLRISVSTGNVEVIVENLPFPNGDLTFGPSSIGNGQSLYIPAKNRIVEISGFTFQIDTQPTPPPLPTPEPTPTPVTPGQEMIEIIVNEDFQNSLFQSADGVWFSFQTSVDGVYLIETATTDQVNVDPVMEVYGPNNQTDFIDGNDDFNQSTFNSRVSLFLSGDSTYFVRIFPFQDASTSPVFGPFSIFVLGPDVSAETIAQRDLLVRYEFGKDTIAEAQWNELPGGFGGFEPGQVSLSGLPAGMFPDSSDQRGLELQVSNANGDNPQLVFLNTIESFDSEGKPLLIKMKVRADSPDASVFLAALKGTLLTSQAVDGSLGINQVNTTVNLQTEAKEIIMVYKADVDSPVNPIIQIVSSGGGMPTTVWIDWLEVYRYQNDGLF